MTKLYIANCTNQNQIVSWRLDFTADGSEIARTSFRQPRSQAIRAGSQLAIGGELPHLHAAEVIVQQLNHFGLRSADEAKYGRLGNARVPYIFNIDRPVSQDQIRATFAHNERVLIEEGRDRRKKAALAAGAQLIKIAHETAEAVGASTGTGDLDVEIEQETFAGDEKPIEEGYRLRAEGDDRPAPPVKRRGRGKASGARA